MKQTIILIASVLFLCTTLSFSNTPPYLEGSMLNVFAPSGLKLRATPNLNGDVLEIVQYGDRVKVLNTFDFDNGPRLAKVSQTPQ